MAPVVAWAAAKRRLSRAARSRSVRRASAATTGRNRFFSNATACPGAATRVPIARCAAAASAPANTVHRASASRGVSRAGCPAATAQFFGPHSKYGRVAAARGQELAVEGKGDGGDTAAVAGPPPQLSCSCPSQLWPQAATASAPCSSSRRENSTTPRASPGTRPRNSASTRPTVTTGWPGKRAGLPTPARSACS